KEIPNQVRDDGGGRPLNDTGSHTEQSCAMRTKPCHAELVSASLVQMRSRIKFGMTVEAGP
ncbi:MAG TPA: hypothetical protein DCM57_02075, partial [Treponema sp.]|nr:hypothetical protein [Treponema sp.]